MSHTCVLGLDLGKQRDPSALVAVERIEHRRAFQNTEFEKLVVRYAERMPLGTPYPKVVERVRAIARSDELAGRCVLVVDATGVGAPVVDMLREARLGCEVIAVTITGSGGVQNKSVAKRDLMAEVQVLLESGRLKIGKLKEGPRLMRELTDVRMSLSRTGSARLGAEGAGEHDDLVTALALACWRAKSQTTIGEVGRNFPGFQY